MTACHCKAEDVIGVLLKLFLAEYLRPFPAPVADLVGFGISEGCGDKGSCTRVFFAGLIESELSCTEIYNITHFNFLR